MPPWPYVMLSIGFELRSMAASTAQHPCWHSEASDGAKMALVSAIADNYELSGGSSAKRAKSYV